MAVVPGKTNNGLAWLLLFLMVSTVCLRPCHASRRCSVKGCMVHFGKRIAPFPEQDEQAVQKATDYQNERQNNLLRLVDRLISNSMTSRNSPIDDDA
ncbi:uncharacterized protein [Asterias amurensis]|uniref:uncharacterized protein isoform X2 n=1 Tax=Asterias amurensis TaxID=7602 RepID=UPI003AB6351C